MKKIFNQHLSHQKEVDNQKEETILDQILN
jgi:hypothetical protein